MGTLIGHGMPGTYFIILGLWWAYRILERHLASKREAAFSSKGHTTRLKYRSSLSFPCCCCQKLPMEAILIVAMTVIGIVGLVVATSNPYVNAKNGQHIIMYFFFGLMSLVDILQHYRWSLPPSMEYCNALLALIVEGVLFYNHLHGRSTMDVQLHMFLLYLILGSLVSACFEMRFRHNPMPALSRAYFFTLQGTWFYQVGLILYPPVGLSPWDQENHSQMMITTMIFACHLIVVFLLFGVIGLMVSCRVQRMSRNDVYRTLAGKSSANNEDKTSENGNGFTNTTNIQDADQMKSILCYSDEEDTFFRI